MKENKQKIWRKTNYGRWWELQVNSGFEAAPYSLGSLLKPSATIEGSHRPEDTMLWEATQTDHGKRPWDKWRETCPASPRPLLSSAVLVPAIICNHRKIMRYKLGVESSRNLLDTEAVGDNKMIIILIMIIMCVSHSVISNSLQPRGL